MARRARAHATVFTSENMDRVRELGLPYVLPLHRSRRVPGHRHDRGDPLAEGDERHLKAGLDVRDRRFAPLRRRPIHAIQRGTARNAREHRREVFRFGHEARPARIARRGDLARGVRVEVERGVSMRVLTGVRRDGRGPDGTEPRRATAGDVPVRPLPVDRERVASAGPLIVKVRREIRSASVNRERRREVDERDVRGGELRVLVAGELTDLVERVALALLIGEPRADPARQRASDAMPGGDRPVISQQYSGASGVESKEPFVDDLVGRDVHPIDDRLLGQIAPLASP